MNHRIAVTLATATLLAMPAQARVFTPPEGCEVFLTVQSKQCSVSNLYRCDTDTGGFAEAMFDGVMDSRDPISVAGLPIAAAFFRALDPDCAIEQLVEDGAQVAPGTDLMRIEGNARALLTAERAALNTVQHLSGIATLVRSYVQAMDNPDCTLLDTRKTLPGLRMLEKYAVRMGGGANHRMGLWDAAMIKDNHVAVAGSVGEAVRRARDAGVADIICEVDRIDQIGPALDAGATRLLLDNMEPDTLREAVALVAGRVPTEASGGINLDTIRAKAATGVDYVSVGRLVRELGKKYHCYLGAMFIGLLAFITSYPALKAQLAAQAAQTGVAVPPSVIWIGYAVGALIGLLMWYLVSQRRVVIAKWVIVAFFLFSLIGVGDYFGGPLVLSRIYGLVGLLAQAAAVVMLFRGDAIRWLNGTPTDDAPPPPDA